MIAAYMRCLGGIVWREALRFLHQRGRFFSALVRPLVWLFIFAAGFRSVLGVSISRPTRPTCSTRSTSRPASSRMILLFNGMQSSLSMVYDREMGSMRDAAGQPAAALVPAVLQAAGGRPRSSCPGLRLPRSSPGSGTSSRRCSAISPCCRR